MPKAARSKLLSIRENILLAALTAEEYQRLGPHLERVSFDIGKIIYHISERLEYLYFPTSSMISLVYTLEDGMTAQVGLTGNDGVVGLAVFLGGDTMPNQAVVQIAGNAYRLKTQLALEEFRRGGNFQKNLLLYTQTLLTQLSQTAICNRLHDVEQRFCRWLLLSHDRVKSDVLVMTQELIASMLGGRRESVTVAAGRLQDAGLINYTRGHITILDRKGLEATVCECYKVVKMEYDRLLGSLEPGNPSS